MTRDQIAEIVSKKLIGQRPVLQEMFLSKSPKTPFFILDDVLPELLTKDIYNAFQTIWNARTKNFKYITFPRK